MTASPESLLALWRTRDLESVLAGAARRHGVDVLDLLGRRRNSSLDGARGALYAQLREIPLTYASIAELFGRSIRGVYDVLHRELRPDRAQYDRGRYQRRRAASGAT